MPAFVLRTWRLLRNATGDDAYEQYLTHMREKHPEQTPLDRKAFFKDELRRKWSGVRRCC